jgi:hypothetical protein
MGVLADIYISRDQEAAGYDGNPNFPASDRVQWKRITPLELSTLWTIMRKIKWEVSFMDEFECLLVQDEGERLIHRLPPAMVTELAKLAPDEIGAIAPTWAGTDEMQWPPETARNAIEELTGLARRAAASNRNLYLWNCV